MRERAHLNTNCARCVGGKSRTWKGCDGCVFCPFHTRSQRRRQWRRPTPGVLRSELSLKICPWTTAWKKIMQNRFSRCLELSLKKFVQEHHCMKKIMQNWFSRRLQLSLKFFVQERLYERLCKIFHISIPWNFLSLQYIYIYIYSLAMKQGSSVCFVMLRSPKPGCFMLNFPYLWKALDKEGCIGLVSWCSNLQCKSFWILNDFFIKIKLNHN
jgi:hypothetical protein